MRCLPSPTWVTVAFTGTGAWQTVTLNGGVVPAAPTGQPYIQVRAPGTTVQTFYVDSALIERAAIVGSYFDGATPDVPGVLDYAWAGTAHASQSTATLTTYWAGPSASGRVFDLQLRERHIDRVANTIDLTLTGDEASLLDYLWTAEPANIEAYAYTSSLRTIINTVVLAKIGAVLEAGTTDAPFKPLVDSTNILINSGFRLNATGWSYTATAGGGSLGAPGRSAITATPEPGLTHMISVTGFGAWHGVGVREQWRHRGCAGPGDGQPRAALEGVCLGAGQSGRQYRPEDFHYRCGVSFLGDLDGPHRGVGQRGVEEADH